jgi:hypothetical protein
MTSVYHKWSPRIAYYCLIGIIVSSFFSCQKKDDMPGQENLAEHDHLIEYEKIFAGDLRLEFSMTRPSADNNFYYLAQNTSEELEYFTIVVGGGQIPQGSLPVNSTGREFGKMTLQGDKLWAKNFEFSPRKFIINSTSEGEIIFLVGGKGAWGYISILSPSGNTIDEFVYQSTFESFYFQDIINIPNTNRYLLVGNSFSDYNNQGHLTHLIELAFDENTYNFEVVREKSLFAYQAWSINVRYVPSLSTGIYALSLQHIPGGGSLLFLSQNLEVDKNVNLSPTQLYSSTSKEGQLQVFGDKIYITGLHSDPQKPTSKNVFFRSIPVICLNFQGEILWRTLIPLSEYDDIPRTIVPHDNYLYLLGSQSGKVKGEERRVFSNALVCKVDASNGRLIKAFTFSKYTDPWDSHKFDLGFILDSRFYIFGSTNEQPVDANETVKDGWFITLNMQDL